MRLFVETDIELGEAHQRGCPGERKGYQSENTVNCGSSAAGGHWRLIGASATAELNGLTRLPGVSSYFKGNDPRSWIRGVPHYSGIKSTGVYEGIDLLYRGNAEQALEFDFVVAPGADPGVIVLEFTGADVSIDRNGDLVLRAENGELRQKRPELFQEIDGVRHPVEGSFVLLADNRVGFAVGRYEHDESLVIDPVLDYSTYLGGSAPDSVRAIAVDAAGNTYLGGRTDSFDFPETNRHGGLGRGDIFVTKINAAGGASLLYSTYVGGWASDFANGIAIDGGGNAYITGATSSFNYPPTLRRAPTQRLREDRCIGRLPISAPPSAAWTPRCSFSVWRPAPSDSPKPMSSYLKLEAAHSP